jgi:hypothetical protein
VFEGQNKMKAHFKFQTVALNTPLFVHDQMLSQDMKLQTSIGSLILLVYILEISTGNSVNYGEKIW